MITLTDPAVHKLQAMLQHESLLDHGLRVYVHGGGCAGLQYGMVFENKAQEDDVVIEVEGIRLYVDPYSARLMEGASIDYEDVLMGGGFRVDNPNALASCACGSSFRTEGSREVEKTCDL
jgi:iron-sulfur cluster assembly protein